MSTRPDKADRHRHSCHTPSWLKWLAGVIIVLGLGSPVGLWIHGRRRHHRAIKELKRAGVEVDVVVPDKGFRGWVCRSFRGKAAFFFEQVSTIGTPRHVFAIVFNEGQERGNLSQDKLHLSEFFPEVTALYLNYNNITDVGLAHLSGLTNLKKVYLDGTQVTETGIDRLKKKIPGLEASTVLEKVEQ